MLLTPVFDIPGAIGTIIPVGFEGGHGTAAGLEPVFDAYAWPEGRDLALTSATCGILFAIIVGDGARQLGGAPGLHPATEAH